MRIYNPLEALYIKDLYNVKIKEAFLEIGSWNMDTDLSTTVALSRADMVVPLGVTGIIINDTGDEMYPITAIQQDSALDDCSVSIFSIIGGIITLKHKLGSMFDDPSFNDPLVDRGYLLVWYLAS